MNAIEDKSGALKQNGVGPAMEVRFHFVDGSRKTFVQYDGERAETTLQQIKPSHLFSQARIVVADDYSKSVFVCSQISRIDLLFNGSGFGNLPSDHVDLVELDEQEFRELVPLHEPTRLNKREQARHVGDLLVSFLELRMAGGSNIYVMNEALMKLPVENHSFMQRLLSGGAYCIRLRHGGIGVINLQNLIGYTVYPGVPEVPADTWVAWPKRTNEDP